MSTIAMNSAPETIRRSLTLYKQALQKFGRIIVPVLNDIPKSLAIAHILRVNPFLEETPSPTWDQRKGFLRVTHDATVAAGVSWSNVTELDKNAYVWGWDLNSAGPIFQKTNTVFFSTPSPDFWKCLYARHVLGMRIFDFLWARRNVNTTDQFNAMCDAALLWGKHISGWSFTLLKNTLTIDLPYVFAVASINGILSSKGFGIRPVLNTTRTQQTFM